MFSSYGGLEILSSLESHMIKKENTILHKSESHKNKTQNDSSKWFLFFLVLKNSLSVECA